MSEAHGPLIVDTNLTAFFNQLVTRAMARQQVAATEEVAQYLVRLLAEFARPESLYDRTPDGLTLKPLAALYADALAAESGDERNASLKRLGDVALFISGVFPDTLNRSLVDVDYYIAMGGNAYGSLSEAGSGRFRLLNALFAELAARFTALVDVLGEVSERAHFTDNRDIMRLYERFLRTGSVRVAQQLRALGIEPSLSATSTSRH
ncbi:MAG: hypothetical protein ACFCBW_12025 [Candidatus Competibacterales bacterium]